MALFAAVSAHLKSLGFPPRTLRGKPTPFHHRWKGFPGSRISAVPLCKGIVPRFQGTVQKVRCGLWVGFFRAEGGSEHLLQHRSSHSQPLGSCIRGCKVALQPLHSPVGEVLSPTPTTPFVQCFTPNMCISSWNSL